MIRVIVQIVVYLTLVFGLIDWAYRKFNSKKHIKNLFYAVLCAGPLLIFYFRDFVYMFGMVYFSIALMCLSQYFKLFKFTTEIESFSNIRWKRLFIIVNLVVIAYLLSCSYLLFYIYCK